MAQIEQIIPLLVYEDIPSAHDFLIESFGFSSGGVIRDDEGTAIHAEVRAGDLVIWLHQVTAERNFLSPLKINASSSALVVHVDDVDVHYEHARSHGVHIEDEPTDKPYGQREYGARDLEGHIWYFATPLV